MSQRVTSKPAHDAEHAITPFAFGAQQNLSYSEKGYDFLLLLFREILSATLRVYTTR